MITGMHAIIYSRDAEADRAFFRDVLGFPSVDAGGGWLIFAVPHSEVAFHPGDENGKHELYLMCDDVETEKARLGKKGCGLQFHY
jgi:catechol 2,3-dioxygenase-like lactoylglutathione lyase family enzyme